MDARVRVWNANAKSPIANRIPVAAVNVASLIRILVNATSARVRSTLVKRIRATPWLVSCVRARSASPFLLPNATTPVRARWSLIAKIIATLRNHQDHLATIAQSTFLVNPVAIRARVVGARPNRRPNASAIRAIVANAGGKTRATPTRTTTAITAIVVNR